MNEARWTFKWDRQFNTGGPWTKAGGCLPFDWPEWMRRFKDYRDKPSQRITSDRRLLASVPCVDSPLPLYRGGFQLPSPS